MERHMTGITDVDREILMRFDDKELLAVCFSKNIYCLKLCDETFFQNRFFQKFPEVVESKPQNMTWKKFYLVTLYLKNEDPKNRQIFFENIDKPRFIYRDRKLSKFLASLRNGGHIEVLLYNAIYPLFMYGMIDREIALKVIIICKLLNLKETPDTFLDDFCPLKYWELEYISSSQFIKNVNQEVKRNINNIYKNELGNRLL